MGYRGLKAIAQARFRASYCKLKLSVSEMAVAYRRSGLLYGSKRRTASTAIANNY